MYAIVVYLYNIYINRKISNKEYIHEKVSNLVWCIAYVTYVGKFCCCIINPQKSEIDVEAMPATTN